MTLRFHEISESNHRILNPYNYEKLMLLGEICRLQPDMRQLDLACGKAEMLCQWANRWKIQGTGVDISKVFLSAAQKRIKELDVENQISLVEADAGKYLAEAQAFDIVSCIGATWIGNGIEGTIKLMLPALKEGGLMLVGEPYWIDTPPAEAYTSGEIAPEDFTSLIGTRDRIESAGMEIVEMVLADQNSWDRYMAAQWWTVYEWLRANPDDPDAQMVKETNEKSRSNYLEYERRFLGWGVFVLRVR